MMEWTHRAVKATALLAKKEITTTMLRAALRSLLDQEMKFPDNSFFDFFA